MSKFQVPVILVAMVALLQSVTCFPSLFSRSTGNSQAPSLFRRGPQQQQQQQQQQQLQQVANTEHMSMQYAPSNFGQFGARGLQPEMSGASSRQAVANAAAHAHALAAAMAAVAQQQQAPSGSQFESAGEQQYRPYGGEQISAHLHPIGSSSSQSEQGNPAEAADAAAVAAAFGVPPSQESSASALASAGDSSASFSNHHHHMHHMQHPMEQSPTGEAVDKIERHISHQIDQALGASQYGHGKAASEKDSSSASTDESAESAAGSSGGESAAADGGEGGMDLAEKRSHEPAEAKHHEEHQHHEEHPPEAFEVHHKKGGKSFQYFHQGHSHP